MCTRCLLFGLRLLELALYFRQEEQRIARCDYCWGYFIPRTKKITRYCDRVIDGFTCKKRGARFQRNESQEHDAALRISEQLRERMYARYLRYADAAPDERDRLIPMDIQRYDDWSENARLARIDYMDGKLSAEEFLRKIDTTHELTDYTATKAELVGQTRWQRSVAHDWSLDSAMRYPEKFMFLDLRKQDAAWGYYTADDFRRYEQQGTRVCGRSTAKDRR